MSGEELIEKLRYDFVPDGAIIQVINGWDSTRIIECELEFKDGELYWQPNTFRMSMLYDSEYTFEIIEPRKKNEKPAKIKIDDQDRIQATSTGNFCYKLTQKEKIIIKKLNEVIDYVEETRIF